MPMSSIRGVWIVTGIAQSEVECSARAQFELGVTDA